MTDQPASQPSPLAQQVRRRKKRDVPDRPPPTPTHVAVKRNSSSPALPVLLAALVAIGLIVLAIVLLAQFNNPRSDAHAPWANPRAPVVHPAPIRDQ